MGTTAGGLPYPDGGDTFDPSGDIQVGLTAADTGRIIPVANTTARAALAAAYSPSASKPLYVHRQDAAAGEEIERTIDGTTWLTVFSGIAWASYTPTVTGFNASVTPVARYMMVGRTVHYEGKITTGGAATGSYTVTLPTAAASNTVQAAGTGPMGTAKAVVGSNTYPGIVSLNSTTALRFQGMPTGGGSALALWGAAGPATWGSGDSLHFSFTYEAA